LGFRVEGLEFRVHGSCLRVQGSENRASGRILLLYGFGSEGVRVGQSARSAYFKQKNEIGGDWQRSRIGRD